MDTGWLESFSLLSFVILFIVFLFCLGLEAVMTGEHPYRGGLYNRAARMVRGLDPGVG